MLNEIHDGIKSSFTTRVHRRYHAGQHFIKVRIYITGRNDRIAVGDRTAMAAIDSSVSNGVRKSKSNQGIRRLHNISMKQNDLTRTDLHTIRVSERI